MNSTAIKRTALLINSFSPLRQCCKGNQVNERAFVLLMTCLCTVLTSHKFIWFFFSFFSVVVITLLGDHFIPRQLITITKYTWLFVTVLDNLKPDQNAREVTSKANNPFKAISLLGSCFQKADIKHLSHPQKITRYSFFLLSVKLRSLKLPFYETGVKKNSYPKLLFLTFLLR